MDCRFLFHRGSRSLPTEPTLPRSSQMRRRKTKSIWVRSGFLSSYNLHSLPIFSHANPKVTLNSYRNLQAFWSSGSLRNLLRSLPTLLGPLHLLSRSVLLLANPIRSQASAVRPWILPRGYGYLPYFEVRRRRRRTPVVFPIECPSVSLSVF